MSFWEKIEHANRNHVGLFNQKLGIPEITEPPIKTDPALQAHICTSAPTLEKP